MHRERPIDFWLTLAMVAALFVPIWGVLLQPSGLIRVPVYLLTVGVVAGLIVLGTLVYAEFRNRVLLNRFLVGYAAGFAGSFAVHMFLLVGRLLGFAPDLVETLGKMMLGKPLDSQVSWLILAAGSIYHYMLNGAAWGAVYALVFGKAPWWVGAIYGLGIAAVLMISPSFYVLGFQRARPELGAVVILSIVVVHFIYGTVLGLIVHRYVFPEVGVEGSKAIKPTYA